MRIPRRPDDPVRIVRAYGSLIVAKAAGEAVDESALEELQEELLKAA